MRVDIGAASDVGRVRNNNEDSCRVLPDLQLLVL